MPSQDEKWYCGDCGGTTQTSLGATDIVNDAHVLQYLVNGADASWSAAEKRRVAKRAKNSFVNTEQQLHRKAGVSYGKTYPDRPVLAKEARQEAIGGCYNLRHSGIMRTAALVAERYYWGGIVQNCKDFVHDSHECKLQNVHFAQLQELRSIPVADQSFHCVGIDLVGPLQVSAANNKYIIVVMGYLTKWPKVMAVPDKTAQCVADFFLGHVIARHVIARCPKTVISDNGSEFQGEIAALFIAIHER